MLLNFVCFIHSDRRGRPCSLILYMRLQFNYSTVRERRWGLVHNSTDHSSLPKLTASVISCSRFHCSNRLTPTLALANTANMLLCFATTVQKRLFLDSRGPRKRPRTYNYKIISLFQNGLLGKTVSKAMAERLYSQTKLSGIFPLLPCSPHLF